MSAAAPIVVMAKVPAPGRVKTRLAPLLGAEGAAALARAMAEDVIGGLREVDAPVRVALDGDLDDPWVRGLDAPVEAQREGDLGARLRHALRDGGVAIGTDAPTLPVALVRAALAGLATSPVVFAPAFDGGYVLVGVSGPDALGVFDGIPWSSAETLAASVERARALGLTPLTLGFWYDVDTPADLTFLRTHLRALPPTVAPRTRAFLENHAAPHR